MQQKLTLQKRVHTFFTAQSPAKWEFALAGLLCLCTVLLFAHPDIIETANHSWLLLENTFKGNFLGFYEDVYAHQNDFYYTNAAHYNIVVYLLFALWELPLFFICKLFALSINTTFLYFWAKVLTAGSALLCGWLTYRLAKHLGAETGMARFAGLGFVLSPITLFSVFAMGQYDTFCLLFILLALLFYFKKQYYRFAFVMGAALVCKFFAIFLLLPLLLLTEKRMHKLLQYLLVSLWLYVPTTLLFMGKTGDAGFFNQLMTERLLAPVLPLGGANAPIFLVGFALLLAFCFFYHADKEAAAVQMPLYACLAAFSLLFLVVEWHPQWLVLLVPFFVLTTALAQNKTPYVVLDIVLCVGFLLLSFQRFPGQLEANMMDFGLVGLISGLAVSGTPHRELNFYFSLIPHIFPIAAALFTGGLLAGLVYKMPVGGVQLGDRLSAKHRYAPSLRAGLWMPALCAFGGFFVLPCVFVWLKCFGWI